METENTILTRAEIQQSEPVEATPEVSPAESETVTNDLTVSDDTDGSDDLDNNIDNPEPTTDNPEQLTPERVALMIAEAEQRGYLRGRNEQIEHLMAAPSMFEPATPPRVRDATDEILILNNIRPSIWD